MLPQKITLFMVAWEQQLQSILGENDPTIVERIGTRDEFGEVGSEEYLRGRFGFTPEKIAERVKEAIAKKKA